MDHWSRYVSPDAVTDFDPSRWKIVTSRTFEELQAGDIW